MNPSLAPAIVVCVLVVAFGIAVLMALAIERPDPAETVVAYEEAWDRLDFETLWRLSAAELRDGRSRQEFTADKGQRYQARADLAGLASRVRVETLEVAGAYARAVTRVHLRNGEEFRHDVRLRRDGNRWAVVQYRIRSADSPTMGGGANASPAG